MKAIIQERYGSVDVLQLGEIDRPVVRHDEVLIRVHAAGVELAHRPHSQSALVQLLRRSRREARETRR